MSLECLIVFLICFAGRLFPLNERATRTIRNLYVENERVSLLFDALLNICCAALFSSLKDHTCLKIKIKSSVCNMLANLLHLYSSSIIFSLLHFSKSNDQVVLEGRWQEGFMAMAAIGATNIGSIEVRKLHIL